MPQGTNIPDLDHDIPVAEKYLVQARIRKEIFEFFFCRVLVGERGPRNALIVFFFHKLWQACKPVFGEKPVFDFDNEAKLMQVLLRMNFDEPQQQRPAAGKTKKQKEQP